jgi:hypothetical protein
MEWTTEGKGETMRFATIAIAAILVFATLAVAVEKKEHADPTEWTRGLLDCTNAVPVVCGGVYDGDNANAPNNVEQYSCTTWTESGGEIVYTLDLGGTFSVTATLSNMTADFDVFMLGSCEEADCLTYGDSNCTYEFGPGTLYIVVDGYYGATGTFTLTIDCVEIEQPCCPTPYHCYVVDYNDVDEFYTLPCGGAPVWQWGPDPVPPEVACDDIPVTNLLGTIIGGDYPVSAGEIAVAGPFSISVAEHCYCMELCHWYDIETSYDGGNVKVSADGGATWTLVHPQAGYPGATYSYCPCVPGEPAYTGHPPFAFIRDCFDLSDFDGMEILVGFFFGSDSSVTYPGWYIKWVKIGGEEFSPVEDSSWGSIKGLYR